MYRHVEINSSGAATLAANRRRPAFVKSSGCLKNLSKKGAANSPTSMSSWYPAFKLSASRNPAFGARNRAFFPCHVEFAPLPIAFFRCKNYLCHETPLSFFLPLPYSVFFP